MFIEFHFVPRRKFINRVNDTIRKEKENEFSLSGCYLENRKRKEKSAKDRVRKPCFTEI